MGGSLHHLSAYAEPDCRPASLSQADSCLPFERIRSCSPSVRVDSFPADEFVPPAGAMRMQFCETPETTGEGRPSTGNAIPIGLRDTEVARYFQVSPLGGVKNAEVVSSTNPLKNREIIGCEKS